MVKIRLAVVGKKNAPIYRIVAADSRSKRNGEALEILGTYDPRSKQFAAFHNDKIEAWIKQGAQMTDSVNKLVKLHRRQAVVA